MAAAGAEVRLRVRAEAVPEPTYQWYRDGLPIPGAESAELTLRVTAADGGARFTAIVRNLAGAAVTPETRLRVDAAAARP